MQRKNFLFERSDLTRQTSTMLSKKLEFKPLELSNVSANLLSQFNLFDKQQFDENSNGTTFLATPPMGKQSVTTPKAPVKNKTRSKKVDLKPKKLQYTEDELDVSSVADSGIYIRSNQSSNSLFCKQHTVKCNRLDPSQKQIRRLHKRLDKIKIQTNDKENDRNVIENTSNTRNNVAQVSSVVFNPYAAVLSQWGSNLDWKLKLLWLQPRRDIGLWIECCRKRCKKWRYTEEYHDPLDVPEIWYCEMNSDKSVASCNIPERPISPAVQEDLVENAYNAGSIVWAYISGFPWWPGIINDCPTTFEYYKLPKNSRQPTRYFVTFFNEDELESAWIHKKNIKPFASTTYNQLIKKTKVRGIDYKNSLERAHEIAVNALPLSILQRLQNYSYLAQYEKFYDLNNNLNDPVIKTVVDSPSKMDTNSDDEIPPSNPTKDSFSLKDYYFNVLCKNQNTR